MFGKRGSSSFSVTVCALLLFSLFSAPVWAQGLPQSPYSASSVVRGGLDLAPSNPLGAPSGGGPRGSDSILLTPQLLQGILPPVPNLQVGYLYSFGKAVKSSRLTTDFVLPISLSRDSTVFGEAHGEFTDFWKTVTGGANHRIDLSFGGGIRTIRGDNTLLGVNGFFDTTRLGGRWYSSGSVGCEMAALLPGNDALDLNFNWYGSLFKSSVLANAFRRGPQNYDFVAGYSHELYEGGPDLRLNVTGYRFSAGSGVYGIRGGAEVKTRDGMFSVKYEAGRDRLNSTYHTVGAFVNVGLQIENLLVGESPFDKPEPIFASPRNLRRRLTAHIERGWNGPGPPTAVIQSVCSDCECDTLVITQVLTTAQNWAGTAAGPGGLIFQNLIPECAITTYNNWTFTWSRTGTTGNRGPFGPHSYARRASYAGPGSMIFVSGNSGSAGPFPTTPYGPGGSNGLRNGTGIAPDDVDFPAGTTLTLTFAH